MPLRWPSSQDALLVTIIIGCAVCASNSNNSKEPSFTFKRVDFPLKLSFALSISKAQGQTLMVAGLHLGNLCFSHGQLYMGFSRMVNSKNLYVFAKKNKKIKK